jgi:riboflavin synthase
MFTGLVQAIGAVRAIDARPTGARLEIEPAGPTGPWGYQPAIGESIAVAGCCLTVASTSPLWAFDVVHETLSKTTLGVLSRGSRVNLEHALTPTSLLGGHLVQGHVDGVGAVERVQEGSDWRVRIRPPAPLMEYLVPKGSVTVDGVSLTLAAVDPAAGWFEVALIPTTLELTTLGELREGHRCNLEADMVAKTLIHWARNYSDAPPPARPRL